MSLDGELAALSTAAAQARDRVEQPDIKDSLAGIKRICDQAKRAWSGSNLGYHAFVYYEGIVPKPAGVSFNPEWGLLSAWPTHEPDDGWVRMDYHEVFDELVRRAGDVDVETIEETLQQVRGETSRLKERGLSLLGVAQGKERDEFIDRQLSRVREITLADQGAIASTLVMTAGWSRDSEAATQGVHIAPHQTLIALQLSAVVLINALKLIEEAADDVRRHLAHKKGHGRQVTLNGKKIFIGHGRSKIWLELQNFIRDRLGLETDEFNRISVAGLSNKERLEQALDEAAFAFLVMTPEDEQVDGAIRARQNVVHEVGLFQGRLGFRKAIVIMEEPCEEFSNIHGLGQLRFPKDRLSAIHEQIRLVLEREGLVAAP